MDQCDRSGFEPSQFLDLESGSKRLIVKLWWVPTLPTMQQWVGGRWTELYDSCWNLQLCLDHNQRQEVGDVNLQRLETVIHQSHFFCFPELTCGCVTMKAVIWMIWKSLPEVHSGTRCNPELQDFNFHLCETQWSLYLYSWFKFEVITVNNLITTTMSPWTHHPADEIYIFCLTCDFNLFQQKRSWVFFFIWPGWVY